ncbi:MAG: hypothetical protein HOO96_27705 [Polyangiaceae bacterium]|nr:hypothetical protein [Polyangiaceae bacterium]
MSGVRGITVGPIENAYHPGKGYGSEPYQRTLGEARQMGARWIALTPFGRVGSLAGYGVDPSFEAPFEENKKAVAQAIRQAHAQGLSVMLVPHLWVESGEWRALIDPGSDAGWRRWSESYGAFLKGWAKVAAENQVDLLSVGVELRSWVTSTRAPSFSALVHDVRAIYKGPLTYSANWDDVDDTVILGDVDVIGINAFYPLAEKEGADLRTLREGGERVRSRVQKLASNWQKPVLFTEIGYTTRKDPAVKPWEWPDAMKNVVVDQKAQADAYAGLLGPLLEEPAFAGFFVWRVYADPDDVSQEAEWGFSPRGKLSELVMRDAFRARWASEATTPLPFAHKAAVPGLYEGPAPAR